MAVEQRAAVGGASASIALVWPFLALAEQAGRADAAPRLCAYLGLTEAELADPATRVPVIQLATLLGLALGRSGDRDLGLRAAERVDGVHLGLMEDVTRSMGTLRAALEQGIRYVPLIGEGVHYELAYEGKLAIGKFWFDPGIRIHEAAVEFVLAVGLLWARRMTGIEALAPLEVHFTHPRPPDVTRHERLFRCALFFDAPVAKVVMATRFLDRRLRGAEPVLAGLLRTRAERMLRALPRAADTAGQVRQVLASQRELHHVTADHVAGRLGVGTRTLARRLREEQTSYREVLDDVRRQAAERALTEGERSIADIAERLGFASTQSFNRAFRRWTGSSPASYRRRGR